MTDEEKKEIKYRLSDIGAKVGELALEYIAELEEENEGLKEQCSILADCNTCYSTCKNENIEMKKQLIKAKEIIQKLCDIVCGRSGDDQDLLNRAEQFLREVEE